MTKNFTDKFQLNGIIYTVCSSMLLLSSGCHQFSGQYKMLEPDGNNACNSTTDEQIVTCICYQEKEDPIIALDCHHTHQFHKSCIIGWMCKREECKFPPSCPCCQKEITTIPLLQAMDQARLANQCTSHTANEEEEEEEEEEDWISAIYTKDLAALEELSARNTVINPDDYLLHHAVNAAVTVEDEDQCLAMIDFLVASGVDLNSQCKQIGDLTALHVAINKLKPKITAYLIEKRANLDLKNEGGMTALHLAIDKRDESVVQLLIGKGANVDLQDEYGRTALHWGVLKRNPAIVKLLIENRANLNIKDNTGATPLASSIAIRAEAVRNLLIENRADLNIKDAAGHTLLYNVIKRNDEEDVKNKLVELLINHGAAICDSNNNELFLHQVASYGTPFMARLLLEKGTWVDVQTTSGLTALSLAACQGKEAMVNLLLAHHADPNVVDKKGSTPLHKAALQGHVEVVSLLLAHLAHHADLNVVDEKGRTPLHEAASGGCTEVVSLLLNNNANPDLRDTAGNTPLDLAKAYNHPSCIALLQKSL